MKPVKRLGTVKLLKLLRPLEGTPARDELLNYIGRLETNERDLFGFIKQVQLPEESFQLKYAGFNPIPIRENGRGGR